MASISLDDLQQAGLTPEEMAAIEGDKPSAEDQAALKSIAGGADDDADDGDDDGDDSDEVVDANGNPVTVDAGKTETTAKTDKPAADAAATAAKTDDEPAAPVQAGYTVKLPDDFSEQVEGLKSQEADLRAKFKAGEIEVDEYEAQRDQITAKRSELDRLSVKAEISQEMTAQQAQNAWQTAITDFFKEAAKTDGVDYRKDTARAEDLDQFIKVLANKDEHSDKPMSWFLQEAHKRVQALHGAVQAKPAAEEKPKPASRKPPLDAAPKTLAQVPGGDGPGDIGGEFAHLDALDGDELEFAIAKMTPQAREKYSRGL